MRAAYQFSLVCFYEDFDMLPPKKVTECSQSGEWAGQVQITLITLESFIKNIYCMPALCQAVLGSRNRV